MRITIKTLPFQSMVARAAKGASENKLLPITSMMEIELSENILTLTTTDTSNTLTIIQDKVEGEDFYAVVPVDIFSKLIAKTTAEKVTLTVKENSLEVQGNGVYNIALPMDEDGTIKFPRYTFEKVGTPARIHLSTIKQILAVNKPAIAKNLDTPCLCGYYLGNQVITTDENVICFNDMNVMGMDVLVSPEMMELLSLNTEENIDVYYNNGYFVFQTPDMVLYGAEHDGKSIYPVSEISAYLDEKFKSNCTVSKILLESVIDRLSLFIEPYDKNGAYLIFTKDGLNLTSKKSSSVELVSYMESNDFQPFACCVDIPMFQAQIAAIPSESVKIWYGHDAALKMTSGNITQIIALLEDEDLESVVHGIQ